MKPITASSAMSVLSVRLRTTDLVAQSTGEMLHRAHPDPAALASVDRQTVWLCAWSEDAVREVALASLTRPGVLHNPNKEALVVADDAAAIIGPASPHDALVATWPHDHEAEIALRGILRRAGCDPSWLAGAWCVTLWGLRAAEGAGSQAAFAADVAEVRGRGQGVLANPHLTSCAVFARAVRVSDLTALVLHAAPASSPVQGVSA